jgi:hypothetical protein
MRTFTSIVLILAVVIGAIALYLYATTPNEATPVRFPLSASQLELLKRVPASAEAFALVPTAPLFYRKLMENPVTRDPVLQWTSEHAIPSGWLLGGADIVIWKTGKKTSYSIRLDPFRAFLVRVWLTLSSSVEARWDGRVFTINSAGEGPQIPPQEIESILALAKDLPEGDVFAVQRRSARGVFPPIGRPAVSSLLVTPKEILLVARAEHREETAHAPVQARFPRGAMLAVTFAKPPRVLGDLGRFLGTDIGALVAGGGSIALYDVDTGTLLPRPKGVIAVLADEERRAAAKRVVEVAEMVGETRDTGREILISFDRSSLGLYLKDAFDPAPWPATRWAVRIDPQQLVPVLEELGDSRGLRFASGRLHRAVRDLGRWISALQQAESTVATDSTQGGIEELRVRIASK